VLLKEVDGLGFTVFNDLKVLLVEAGDRIVIALGDDHVNDDGTGVGLEGGDGVWCGGRGGLRGRRRYR